ncbi:MAG: FxsA family protein [Pseudomonadota bacterium]
MWIFLALLVVPLIEIGLFIEVGGLIGLWPTIAVVIGTALLGTVLLRAQGLAALRDLQSQMNRGEDPSRTLAHGALILVAGVVLLTPGFFTDAIGFLLLVPPVRAALIASLGRHVRVAAANVHVHSAHGPPPGARRDPGGKGPVIDGSFETVETEDEQEERPTPPGGTAGRSGWTRPGGG